MFGSDLLPSVSSVATTEGVEVRTIQRINMTNEEPLGDVAESLRTLALSPVRFSILIFVLGCGGFYWLYAAYRDSFAEYANWAIFLSD